MHMDALKSSKIVIENNTHTSAMGSDFVMRHDVSDPFSHLR